ncbi:MAG: hypothetical protein LLG01_00765 [Planctomycetaceae bacterium]|nr:hypothetical protein [Planctomycetaceae bacterium]
MVTDVPLFLLARQSDPVTSDLAAEEIQRDGTHAAQMRIVYAALCTAKPPINPDTKEPYPGCTSREIAVQSGLERHEVGRRLPDLARVGRSARICDEHGEPIKRKCEISGKMAITWEPVFTEHEG